MESTPPSLQLAMAAFVGASLMAVSAFYIHKRSIDQILQRLIEIRKLPPPPSSKTKKRPVSMYSEEEEEDEVEEDYEENDEEIEVDIRYFRSSLGGGGGCCSSSLPDVAMTNHWMNDQNDNNPIRFSQSSSSFSHMNSIPLGLPPLQTVQRVGSHQSLKHSGSRSRLASVGIPSSPKSAGGAAFESLEESDDEDTLLSNEEDQDLSYDNVDSAPVDYYVYRENIVPWKREATAELPNKDPFHFEPVKPTE
ncbi:hypothetical protein MKX01_032371, partial [Papaver californicum]